MNTLTISDGRTIKVQIGWVIVNPETAPKANHVCVISVRNAPDNMPVFLYLLEGMEVRQLKRDPDLDRIDAAIVAICPEYQKVIDQRIWPILKDGVYTNVSEWQRSSEPGYFDLDAWPQFWEGVPNEE
jgi:hypothetical protein